MTYFNSLVVFLVKLIYTVMSLTTAVKLLQQTLRCADLVLAVSDVLWARLHKLWLCQSH